MGPKESIGRLAFALTFIGCAGNDALWASEPISRLEPAQICQRIGAAGCPNGVPLAKTLFDAILAAAGFTPGEIKLVFDNISVSNAHYSEGVVFIHEGLMKKYGTDAEALVFMIAHELGHAQQEHFLKYVMEPELDLYPKRTEAHADLLGANNAVCAGYPFSMVLSGLQKVTRHDHSGGSDAHPSGSDRIDNVSRYHGAVHAGGCPSGRGGRYLRREAFTEAGIGQPSQFVPQEVKDQYLQKIKGRMLPPPSADARGALGVMAKAFYDFNSSRLERQLPRQLDEALDLIIVPPSVREAGTRAEAAAAVSARLAPILSGDFEFLSREARKLPAALREKLPLY